MTYEWANFLNNRLLISFQPFQNNLQIYQEHRIFFYPKFNHNFLKQFIHSFHLNFS